MEASYDHFTKTMDETRMMKERRRKTMDAQWTLKKRNKTMDAKQKPKKKWTRINAKRK
jgi:hypothetical protein